VLRRLADDLLHDLRRAAADAQDPGVAVEPLDKILYMPSGHLINLLKSTRKVDACL